MRKIILLCLTTLLIINGIKAQESAVDYSIHFKSLTMMPEPNAMAYLGSFEANTEQSYREQIFKIVQFYQTPGQEEKKILSNAGIELLDYLPERAYFAALSSEIDISVLKNMGIRSITDVAPDFKLDRLLFQENYPGYAIQGDGKIRLMVSYYPNLEPSQVIASLAGEGFKVESRDDFGKFAGLVAPISDIRRIAALPYVVFVEPGIPEPEPENYTGRTLHHTNVIASDYGAGRHYDGANVNVMLQDDGIIGPHIDYQGRIGAQFLTNNGGNHGDHCAGIIMGGGNIDSRAKGNAFGATLYVYSVNPSYPGFAAIPTVYSSLGIRITSASYGDGCNSGYTSLTRTLDQQVRTYPSLLHVFSAGNSGTDNCGYGAGAGWGNITGGHKVGKNVIAVANLDYQDNLAGSSSRGPAHDGRIKPDLAAKGTDVYSTVDPNTYAMKSGTSMACPGAAGTLAQLIQAYRELNNGNDPMAGLLKAIMLNTAEDLGNPGPDFKHGWGRLNAMRAVQVIEEQRFDSGSITQGVALGHTIQVPANTAQLRVMVYWTDYQASVNATVALVNNLNITLTDPSSAIWQPWVLSHYPHPDSLNKPAIRGIDARNNMEQVTIDNPAAGTYDLNVQGFNIPQGPQTYYVVYEFIPDAVILTYPIGGETLAPGEIETIRWDAFGSGETFTIEYSPDNGQNWDTVATDIAGTTRFYNWTVPNQVSSAAMLRITRGGSESQCEEPFSILGVPCNVKVDWACTNTIHLSWDPVIGATSYKVFKLGEKYMDSVGITSNTSYIVDDTTTVGSTWLSVQALSETGTGSRRAVAVQKQQGLLNCHPVDAWMFSVPVAEWGVYQSVIDLTEVSVPVVVKNFGIEPINNPILHFQVDNGPIFMETYAGTIAPDSILKYTFTEKIDISGTGTYMMTSWIDAPGDLNFSNDTLRIPIEVIEGSTMHIGSMQTFDNWTKCLSAPICEAYSCVLQDGWLNLENNVYDQHDWRTFSGGTPTSGTGPQADHTLGTAAGYYLYIEPSLYCLNKVAMIILPCIDLTGGIHPGLKFWYHANGPDIGSFHIDLFTGSEVIMDVAAPIIGSKGNEWKKMEIDLTPWAGSMVGIRFRGVTTCKEKGDFAIDDVSVEEVITTVEGVKGTTSANLSLYPNPARGEVTISVADDAGKQDYKLNILDMFGRVVYSMPVKPNDDRIHEVISLSHLVAGTYLLELRSDEKTYQKKLSIR